MRFLRLFCVMLFILMLFACVAVQHKDMQKESICKKNCMQKEAYCKQHCMLDRSHCKAQLWRTTKHSYEVYQSKQQVIGASVALQCKSFSNPLQCRKPTCDCEQDLLVCLEFCSGSIHKRLYLAPYPSFDV